jgi:hypothetical protein
MLCELLASPPELSSSWFGYPSSMMAPENECDGPTKGRPDMSGKNARSTKMQLIHTHPHAAGRMMLPRHRHGPLRVGSKTAVVPCAPMSASAGCGHGRAHAASEKTVRKNPAEICNSECSKIRHFRTRHKRLPASELECF